MKREMDLIRETLLALEGKTNTKPIRWDELEIDGFDKLDIGYSLILLFDNQLIDGECIRSKSSDRIIAIFPARLTWMGHEFLELVRDPQIWAQTKDKARSIGNFGIETIAALAKGFLKTKIERHTGIEVEF